MKDISHPLRQGMERPEVGTLQDALRLLLERGALLAEQDGDRRELSHLLQRERAEQRYDRATTRLVACFQREHRLPPSGEVDEPTARALNALLEKLGAHASSEDYRVTGRVTSRVTASVGGLTVLLVDKGVGGDLDLARTTTDLRGDYQASFTGAALRRRGKDKPDLQARVLAGERLIGASAVRYDASLQETLNVLLDDKASPGSEYETLTAALSAHYKGSLGELRETDERQDITWLAHKSSWDARAVALAALADQFSRRTTAIRQGAAIEAPFFYALFRAGLPANEAALYRTDHKAVEAIWKQAIAQGILPATLQKRLPAAVEQFQQLAVEHLLEGPPIAGASTLRELLAVSLEDHSQQQQFAELHTRYRDDPAQLWKAARETFGEEAARRLRLDGQLAYLTLNNAPLIADLHAAAGRNGLQRPSQLVERGLYRTSAWREALGRVPIPPEIPGKDDDERRKRYAELLAAQVRLSFPTAVVAEGVKSGEVELTSANAREPVHAFLVQHADEFEIGAQPIAQYVALNGLQVPAEVTRELTRIQRIYQITPDDQAMKGLLEHKLDSAHAVARYDRNEFVRAFQGAVGGEHNAHLIHAKAQQVHSAVLNLALTFLTARGAPGIGVHSPASIVDPTPSPPANAADVLAYATLESLFGEMDYCACDHCRSVLSPAAYLVDLLLFIDRPASEVPAGFSNPQAVLLDRRPDLQHLPLTCENTHTPVPYVDLVNETLEYFISNSLSLAGYTGHTTDDSRKPEELLASPQFVSDAAYATLAEATFPPPLPFHQPLETLRRHFDRFEAPLPEVMEALRKGDALERGSPVEYGWRDIWMETLGLSRAEHDLLTERWLTAGATDVLLTVKRLYGFDPATPDADVRAVLDNAKTFCRRVELTYEQLAAILRTRFVNPHAHLLPRLERLGVSFTELAQLKDGTLTDAQFDASLAPALDPQQYGGDIRAWVRDEDNYARIMGLITLSNPASPGDLCSFDQVELRYTLPDAGASKLRPFEFIRLGRFVRLWKKLGWSVEQTDQALTALYPAVQSPDDSDDAVNLERLDAGLRDLLPRLGVLQRSMSRLGLSPHKDLLPLLACVAPLDRGLYRQMFLGTAPVDDAFADDGYGGYLSGDDKLLEHADTLRAAFALTSSELDLIVASLSYDASTALTADAISAIFRRGWLARRLKLSVRELLLLVRFTGLDPFDRPDPVRPAILALVGLTEHLRALGIKPVQILYLIWNQDLSGRSSPSEATVRAFARSLRGALAAIEGELARVDDPDGVIARAHMALVYGNEATDLFFGLLDNTFVAEVPYAHGQAALEQAILDAAPGRIAYDDFKKRLSFAGLLDTSVRDGLKGLVGVSGAFQDAVDGLYAENHAITGPFFARYPELQPLYGAYATSTAPLEQRRTALLDAFLPALMARRKRQQALQSISSDAGVDLLLASALLEDAAVLHAAGDPNLPAVEDLVASERRGLTARFYSAPTATGSPDLTRDADANLRYAPSGAQPLPPHATTPGAPISATWSGQLEATENGFYNFRVDTDAASVTLVLGGAAVALAQSAGTWSNTVPVELRAGTLYAVELRVENVKDSLTWRWQTAGRGWEVLPAAALYPETLTENLRRVYVRFLKAAALATALQLTAAEMAWLAAHPDHQASGEGWLNRLPVAGDPDNATATSLFEVLEDLVEFGRIKVALSPADERLLQVLQDPAAATASEDGPLYALTRWDESSLGVLLSRFGKTTADLAHLETLGRVYDAALWATRLGVSASALAEMLTNEPTADIVRGLQSALRARYDESSWLEVLKPIHDEMRSAQRDALVAYVLHHLRSNPLSAHIDTADKLFEYFLMDVQMEPCMLTSRVRHALSSVQLFVERCLMNLEPRVSPASLQAKQWEWMKRYRVWEANRKVFLFPENWLEPELRDDQSPFFKEAMSELLQGDITEDRAAGALLSYLTKLEEVAKLEVCAVHYVENDPGTADDIAHILARTTGANRRYFYRRREYGYWTPWEKVTLDIEDNPVLPFVWKGRLFLFWLKLLQEAYQEAPPAPGAGRLADLSASQVFPNKPPRFSFKAILNWSEHLGGKWQPTRTSDPASPLPLGIFELGGASPFDRSKLKLSALVWSNDGLRIIVSTQVGTGASFFLYNPHSAPEIRDVKKGAHFSPKRTLDTTTSAFQVSYAGAGAPHVVLHNNIGDRTVEPHHPLQGNPWDAPFFYEDSRHAFYVQTQQRVVKPSAWDGFGLLEVVQKPLVETPRLVFKQEPLGPAPGVPVARQPGFGTVDPSPVEHFVSEDAYIRTALGTAGTVRYGDKDIGPSGSQFLTIPTR